MRASLLAASMAVLVVALNTLPALGRDSVPENGQPCKMPPAQRNSLALPIFKLPIPIAIDSALSEADQKAIAAAAATWNEFSRNSLGFEFFELSNLKREDFSNFPLGDDYCKLPREKRHNGLVVVKVPTKEKWNVPGQAPTAGGKSSRCSYGAAETPVQLAIRLNYPKVTPGMLQSIMLHELGHSLGLHHSCEHFNGIEKDGRAIIDCAENKSSAIIESVMHPDSDITVVKHGSYVIRAAARPKEELRTNDMERMYCLYSKQRKPAAVARAIKGLTGGPMINKAVLENCPN